MVENHVPDSQIQSVFVDEWKKQIKHRSGHVWLQDIWDPADQSADSVAEDFRQPWSQESCVGRFSKVLKIIPTCGNLIYNIIYRVLQPGIGTEGNGN
ncbi:hypothetical protein HanIR_Chr04g0188411 [Helianthus annuus]|nr:hypothetical protein HanIR_Chr04g0188411 [Helianthus annuus]